MKKLKSIYIKCCFECPASFIHDSNRRKDHCCVLGKRIYNLESLKKDCPIPDSPDRVRILRFLNRESTMIIKKRCYYDKTRTEN